ncbi:MAG: GGDEF domain-containing protein [Bacilli bacterium]
MKIKKKKSIIILISIIIVLIIIFLGTLYYISSTVNKYSYNEKKWLNSNRDKTLDIYIEPNLPVFSNDGQGVYYNYLTALKTDTGLNFNIVTTDESNVNLVNKNSINENDVIFYKDHYVIIGNEDVSGLTDLNYKVLGILSTDEDAIKYYLTEYNQITFKKFETFDELKAAYINKQIHYLVVPMYKYIDKIIESDYSIVYHLDGLYSYYCLNFDDNNENLKGIMTKFYNRWHNKSNEEINSAFLNVYYDIKKYTELEKASITNEDFIVGYINNIPYEGKISHDFTGLTNTFLTKFADMTGVTYKYIEYKDTKELSNALSDKKIDLMLNYYSLSSSNYDSSRTLGSSEYVVLAHRNNNIVVNSLYSLKNINVDMIANMNLKYSMASKNLFEINDFASIESMIKNVNEDSIIIVEKEVYDYYKDTSLKNYSIRYTDSIKLNNSFLFNKDNEAFNKLFDFYLSTLSTNEVKNESVYDVVKTLKNNRVFNFIVSNLIYLVIAILVLSFSVYAIIKKLMNNKKSKKEDRLYYFDVMTNLKNRNYLNDNIDSWSSTKVYPQAIIVIDINNLKMLNDKYGHEAGDNQIKAVASVLIKTQRDNSEIMRTDGDEFIIYLVGYDEKKIGTYIHKLNRGITASLVNKDFGVSIGYAMILNEQTTIDDAINDSISMIKKSKAK